MIASLPVTSLLAFIRLYLETGDGLKVAALSWQIIGLVIPSLAFFAVLAVTGDGYGLTLYVVRFFR